MRGWIIAGGVLWALSGPAAAAAQSSGAPADDEARTHFESGRLHYKRGNFDQAASAFESAYELSDRPELLYNVYLAHRDAGNIEPATEALARYLELVPDPPRRAHLEARLGAMRKRIASSDNDGGAGRADAGDDASEREGEGEGEGESGASSGGPSEHGPPESGSAAGPALVGAGAALVVTGAITGGLALKKESGLQSDCSVDRVCDPSLRSDRDRGRALAIATDVLVPVGAVLAGVGAIIWLLGDEDPQERPAASAACTRSGCGAAVRWSF
ncbi:MAG: tetratricopeptide repeat protein [Polyangiales bacterium]